MAEDKESMNEQQAGSMKKSLSGIGRLKPEDPMTEGGHQEGNTSGTNPGTQNDSPHPDSPEGTSGDTGRAE